MEGVSSLIAAGFSSFEDFSSRIILMPLHDDDGTGAKVGSHEVPREVTVDENAPPEGKVEPIQEGEAESPVVDVDLGDKEPVVDCSSGSIDASQKNNMSKQQATVQVPVGYVVVKIRNVDESDISSMPDDLENIEFGELLSILRESSFPLSLVFAPPHDSPTSQETSFFESVNDETKDEESCEGSNRVESSEDDDSSTKETNEASQSLAKLVSREDAAKYAKQAATAATELRGRLSSWGYQAATRAVDAASQVKELRDERQRKIQEGQQIKDDQNEGAARNAQAESAENSTKSKASERALSQYFPARANNKPCDVEGRGRDESSPCPKSSDPMLPCFVFLQTPLGFRKLTNTTQRDPNAFPSITNNSVVSVRLSKEKACPLGKNGGYTFQWYRSNEGSRTGKEPIESSEDNKGNPGQLGWSLLRGACYAAYHPSVSDAGHYLRCLVRHDTDGNISHQTCHLPCVVKMDQSLLGSVKNTILGGKKSVLFGNLRELEGLTNVRLKIEVDSKDDFISSSSILIDKVTGGGAAGSQEIKPVSHFKVEADPAKPRVFDLVSSSHGRLRLDAANRKSRESLILALGIANFKGRVSSLTPESRIFTSYDARTDLYGGNYSSPAGSIDEPTPNPDVVSSDNNSDSHSQQLAARLSEMNRLLDSKDTAINELQNELISSDTTKREVQKELESYRDAESQVKGALTRCEKTLEEKIRVIECLQKARHDREIAQEKNVKALNNEKAVFTSMIEARDRKIEGLTKQVSESKKKASLQSEQLSTIETLKRNLAQTQEKSSSAERLITKMKENRRELEQDLKNANGMVRDLNDKLSVAKETALKCESECRKLKMERCSLRNRAEGLKMEMLRLSKNNLEASEVEKLKVVTQVLRKENNDLQKQIEVEKSTKKEALGKLDATLLAHQQSVNYTISTNRHNDAPASEQRIGELESVISSMTEYLNAKEMQIETMKQVNEALAKEIHDLTQQSPQK